MRARREKPQPVLPNSPRSLGDVVLIALENLSEETRGDIRAICAAVKDIATATEWLIWGEQNLAQGVRNALRTKDSEGTPRMVSVGGKYRDPKQLLFPDFVEWSYAMAKRGHEMYGRAREVARLCVESTGRTFDPETVIESAAAGESFQDLIARLKVG